LEALPRQKPWKGGEGAKKKVKEEEMKMFFVKNL
jgi:hypothetical protein